MKKNLIVILAVVAIVAALTVLSDIVTIPLNHTRPETGNTKRDGSAAPDFRLQTPDGQTIALSKYGGKPVVLHFWATWCPPCLTEFPKLDDMAKRFRGRLTVIAVSSDMTEDDLRRFIAQQKKQGRDLADVKIVWDGKRAVTRDLYQSYAYPETIIIDAKGRMIRKIAGDADWTGDELMAYLETLAPLAAAGAKP